MFLVNVENLSPHAGQWRANGQGYGRAPALRRGVEALHRGTLRIYVET